MTLYGGLQLPDPVEGELMMEVVVLIKMLDGEGQVRYREFKTNTLHSIEALGMVTTMADTLRASIMGNARGRPSS